MTIDQILKEIHKIYEGDTNYPDASSDDFSIRLALANLAINAWENEEGVVWKQLFKTYEGTTSDGTDQYTAPSDFIYPAGFLRLYKNGTSSSPDLYEYLSPEHAENISKALTTERKIYWITGGVGKFKINIYPTPTTSSETANKTFRLDYYKKATTYSTGNETTEPEMTDHYFIIYWVLGNLYLNDGNSAQSSAMLQIASQKLSAMRIKNEMTPFYQPNQIEDISFSGFGN